MDPQSQFKDRYEKYVQQRNSQMLNTVNIPPSSKKFSPNKFYVLGIILGILVIAPIGAFLFLSDQLNNPTQNTVSVEEKSLTSLSSNDEIDREMQKIWGPYYEQAKNDPKLRAAASENIQLRQAALKAGVSNSKISSAENTSYQEVQNKTEENLEKQVVNSRTIDFVSVFKNPLSTNYEQEASKAVDTLNQIRAQTTQGKNLEEAYAQVKNSASFDPTIKLFTNEYITKNSGWNPLFKDAIFMLKPGQTSQVLVSPGGAIILAYVKEANDSKYDTVNQYINNSK
jgi:parvulin-like peptidyl-prolyl isomerase